MTLKTSRPSSQKTLEASYSGLSPQLLARTRQLWVSKRLDLDFIWMETVVRLRGFRPLEHNPHQQNSQKVDGIFLFDQGIIWVASLNAAARNLEQRQSTKLSAHQWVAIESVTFRLLERLDAIRLLLVTGLPNASYQIARSISDDIDLSLALLCRPKLAARFVECNDAQKANDFWRRHVAGGRAFKSVSAELYRVGLDLGPDGDYASWRNQVKTVLGAAVHTSFHASENRLHNDSDSILDCVNFVSIRLQEFCTYAHVLRQEFRQDLECISSGHAANDCTQAIGHLTPQVTEVLIDHLDRRLSAKFQDEPARLPL